MQNEKVPAAMQDNVTQAKQDALYDGEAWAELAKEAGFRPYDTESAARRAFEFCAERITAQTEAVQTLVEALERIEFLSTNHGGWFDQPGKQFKEYAHLGDLARQALAAHRESQP
jgi:uncharacterized protein (DUF1697 family)|tara:strand:+ start:14764 stop:15108 length:345 start_codon:yes stop_codon:yes gene_type:complete